MGVAPLGRCGALELPLALGIGGGRPCWREGDAPYLLATFYIVLVPGHGVSLIPLHINMPRPPYHIITTYTVIHHRTPTPPRTHRLFTDKTAAAAKKKEKHLTTNQVRGCMHARKRDSGIT